VGLKLVVFIAIKSLVEMPQSNQRGIETRSFCHKGLCVDAGLNRTSVGLKLPQIELKLTNLKGASIEPAWD